MSNGIASTSPRVLPALLIVPLLAVAACSERVPPAPRQAASVSQPAPFDIVRQRSDPARGRVWLLGPQGVFVRDAGTGKLVEVTLPSWQWIDEAYACPPDLAIGPDGEAVVSSNIVPTLWRIDPATLAVSMHELQLDADTNKDFGFSRLEYSAERGLYFAVSEAQGSRWQIDRSLREGWKIAQVAPVSAPCSFALSQEGG